jgi:outer membrane protein assembly factor BamB
MKFTNIAFLALCLLVNTAHASEAEALLKATGKHGGICVVIGAKDLALAKDLAGKSSFYVQVLQPDAKKFVEWGAAAASGALREKLGVRDAKLDPEHYGSKLLNLVIVEDGKSRAGKLDLKGLARILTPAGVLAVREAPAELAAEAKAVGLEAAQRAGVYALFRKPVRPVEWKPCDSLKWRAGMRAHMATAICGPTHGSGKFFYREHLEAEGDWPNGTSHLVARDAYNGRVAWIRKENVRWNKWRRSQFTRGEWTLSADEKGRLFAVVGGGKLVCLDAETGKQRFVLKASGAKPGYVRTYADKYVFYGRTVFSAETGKALWSWKGKYTTLHKDTMVESDGNMLRVRKLADGSEVFKAAMPWRGDRARKKMGLFHAGSHIIVTEGHRWVRPYRATALDPQTGKKLWSVELGGTFAKPARGKKGGTFSGSVSYTLLGDKLLVYSHTGYYHIRGDNQKEVHFTKIDLATGKVEKEDYGPKGRLFGSTCNNGTARRLGDYLFYFHNVWLKLETFERRFPYLVHPNCSLPSPPAYGLIYNSPGRKGGSIQGVTAVGPADIKFDGAPGGKVLRRYSSRPGLSSPTAPGDWPTFRGNNARSNSTKTDLGTKLVKVWEKQIGLGGRSFGRMKAERFGLTQPVIAYGTAYVADISAQRVLALDVKDGKQKWVFHVGSRVDFPPTIYKGLCLFAAKDGFVYCLDAKTGKPVYKLLIAPRERLIGGQEKLESLWPTAADVMIDAKGIAHVSAGFASTVHGGNRVVRFKAETGEVTDSKVNFEKFAPAGYPRPKSGTNIFTEPLKGGWQLRGAPMDDMLAIGNSISRTNEDRAHMLFGDASGRRGGRARGRVIAFDEKVCVSWSFPYGSQSWANKNPLRLMASAKSPKKPLWKSKPIELIADDIVLTPKHAYVVGHYRRVKGEPEIWVLSRTDGKVISKTPVGGFPSFLGTSAAGKRLFVATREGKLICFEGK